MERHIKTLEGLKKHLFNLDSESGEAIALRAVLDHVRELENILDAAKLPHEAIQKLYRGKSDE